MKFKKKILFFIIAIVIILPILPTMTATAEIGDPLGDIVYSDITAYINGSAIPTSIKAGTTMVVVEDLANYGFDVNWNGKDRSLRVERNADKKSSPLKVAKNTKPVGAFKCKYVSTDIRTYLSGQLVESFAIDGQTLIDFDFLLKYGSQNWNEKTREIRLTLDAKGTVKAMPEFTKKAEIRNTAQLYDYVYKNYKFFSYNFTYNDGLDKITESRTIDIIWFSVEWNTPGKLTLNFQLNSKLSNNESKAAAASYLEKMALDLMAKIPDVEMSGDLYYVWYDYPNIRVGFNSERYCKWDNKGGTFNLR